MPATRIAIPIVMAAVALTAAGCSGAASATQADGERRFSWSQFGERFTVAVRGTIELTDDDRDVSRLSPDGSLTIAEGDWLRRWFLGGRRVVLRARGDGTIERQFFSAGRERPYDPEGARWLADVLPRLVRATGLAADARVARILRTEGVTGVLADISRLDTDHVRVTYFVSLIEQADVGGPLLAQALAQAGREIGSDYELARLLIRCAARAMADEPARRAFFDVAAAIDSDYELHRVLANAVGDEPPVPESMAAALEAAAGIGSDYELASFLRSVAERRLIDQAPEPFFRAVETLDSDYERRRALDAVADLDGLPADTLAAVLTASAGIDSDYELASLLVGVVRRHRLDGPLREAYLVAADGLSSSHEQNRALVALIRSERGR